MIGVAVGVSVGVGGRAVGVGAGVGFIQASVVCTRELTKPTNADQTEVALLRTRTKKEGDS
jgi:hypothetical protein